ncbi:hypothetical protein LTS17_001138 [Exophiala oligosperma]
MKPLSDRESTGEDVQLESGFPAAVDIGDSASFTSMPQADGQLKRKLRSRHVQVRLPCCFAVTSLPMMLDQSSFLVGKMIAIGSCIGTGLLIGCGKVLHTGGPLSLVLSFALVGVALAIMMQGLGELAVVLPVSGGVTDYATRFFNDSLGFAVGWQYWLAWVAIFGAEASAFSLLIGYWNDEHKYIPLWISIFIIVNLAVHLFPVNVFAEVEVVVSAVKIISIFIFIIVVWVIMGGGGPHGAKHGAGNWHLPELDNGVLHGFRGIASGFVTAAFATGGTEMVAIVAGEMQAPRRDLPAAINLLMWRIFVFYVVAMLFLTFVVPYNNEALIGGSKTNSSPFIQAIKGAGIQALPDVLNAVVMVCVCSVASSSVYIASRTLKTMADMGYAFRIFNKVDAQGRPWTALIFTASVSIVLAYLNCSSTGAIVFSWFSAISGEAFFIV